MPKHERAPSGHDEPRLNRTRDEMMADFREEMAAKRRRRVVDYTGPVKKAETKPEDYPWMKPGWEW